MTCANSGDGVGAAHPASGHRFRRGLLFFSVIFALLLAADVAVVGHLVFGDLSRGVINVAQMRMQQEAEKIARQMLPPADVATPADVYRLVATTVSITRYVDRLLQDYTIVQRVDFVNSEGQTVFSQARRLDMTPRDGEQAAAEELPGLPAGDDGALDELPGRSAGDSRAFEELPGAERPGDEDGMPMELALHRMGIPVPARALGPDHPEDLNIRRRSQNVYPVVKVPVPGRDGFVQVSLSEAELQRQIEALRRDLLLKILMGAVASLILIVVAYIFVLKLFNKTRRLETEAQMADRLAYVGTLAAGLAHEIRNPLSAMKLNLQMLEAGLHEEGAGEDAEVHDLLQETQGEVDRLGSLVTSFLSYARPARLERKPADLNRIAEETVTFLKADAERRQVHTDLKLAPGLPLVALDGKQVRQALLNIVHNAIAAVEGNGGGTVRLVSSVGSNGEVRLVIEDDGPGIPKERLGRIFQVFYSSKPGGTGLGLPIAQRVMEGHGGSIQVESAAGAGTRFTLTFPTASRSQTES